MLECGVRTVDSIEVHLLDWQAEHSSLFARQLEAIRQLDLAQVDLVDGCRSMVEWVSSRLDVSPSTARDLVLVAKAADVEVEALLANGEVGWERAVAMVRLRLAGATDDLIAQSFGLDLAGDRPVDRQLEADRVENRNRGLRVEISGRPKVLGSVNLEILGGSGRGRRRNHRKSPVGPVRSPSRPPRG